MSESSAKKPSIAIAYSVQRKNKKKKMALGGAVESDTHSGHPYSRNPGTPEKKPDDRRLAEDDYMAADWAGGPDPVMKPDDQRRPKSAYIDTNDWSDGEKPSRKPFASGGEVLTAKPNFPRPSQASVESAALNSRAPNQMETEEQMLERHQQELAKARMYANGGIIEEEGRAQADQYPGTPARKPDDSRRPKEAYIDTDYWSDREAPSRRPFAEGGSVSPTKTSTSSPTKTSTSTTGNKTKTGGSNPGGASTGGAGTVTISTGKMPPEGINISNVGGKTDAANSGGMDPSDEDDEMMMAAGGLVDSIMRKRKRMADGGPVKDEETLGTRIGYPGSPAPSPRPVQKARGGSIQQADEAAQDMVDRIMRKRKAKMMADGGMVDMEENSEEMSAKPGPYDDDNAEAAQKELYDDQQISAQPEDSNEMGDDIDSDAHDMLSAIRRKMRSRRSME